MKKSKKIMSVVISAAMLMSTLAVSASFMSSAATEVYKFDATKVGDTHKCEGWYGWWGEGTIMKYEYGEDGSVTYNIKKGSGGDKYQQTNNDWKDVPSFVGKIATGTITNYTTRNVFVNINYCADGARAYIKAGETKEITYSDFENDKGVFAGGTLNIKFQDEAGATNIPVASPSFKFSPITIVDENGGDTDETTTEPVAEETTTTEPVAEETTTTEPVAEETTTTEPVAEETTTTEPVAEETTTTEATTTKKAPKVLESADNVNTDASKTEDGQFILSDAKVKAGETATFTMSYKDFNLLTNGLISFKYDPDLLTPVLNARGNLNVKDLSGKSFKFTPGPVKTLDDGTAQITVVYSNNDDDTIGELAAKSGDMFSFEFTAKADIDSTSTKLVYADVQANYGSVDADNVGHAHKLNPYAKEATVEIQGKEAPVTTAPDTTAKPDDTTAPDATTTTAAVVDDGTTAATTTTAADTKATTKKADGKTDSKSDDNKTDDGSSSESPATGAVAPIAATVLAAGAAFVAFKARKK